MLTLKSFTKDEDYTRIEFQCDFIVDCAGDSIWSDTKGRRVHVSGITLVTQAYDHELDVQISVDHNDTWDIYTDSGFEAAISQALGMNVGFTEQGMQDDYCASLEPTWVAR